MPVWLNLTGMEIWPGLSTIFKLSDVTVWEVLSLFIHLMVSPTVMLTGLGEYDLSPRKEAPWAIETLCNRDISFVLVLFRCNFEIIVIVFVFDGQLFPKIIFEFADHLYRR